MRVTAQAKLATRRRILEAARDCFSKAGFEAATTRDIATAAGIAARAPGTPLTAMALKLYWTLYTGVLAFWAADGSPHQEDTRAVLDHYVRAFVDSLPRPE